MAKLTVDNIGQLGILTDPHPYSLPPEAFTSGGNVRFLDNRVEKFSGEREIYATALYPPHWAMPVVTPNTAYWVYAGLTGVGVYDGAAHYDITRASGVYNGTAGLGWNGGLLGGVLCLNNGIDVPQYWASNSVSIKLQDLPAWPTGYACRVLVAFKQHLIALNLTIAGVEYPHRVLWSHVADPGTVPVSWDITDATKDAGQQDISDVNSGGLVAALQLGDKLIVYKENAIHAMQPSYDSYIFNFSQLFTGIGALSPHSVVQVPKKRQHFVATGDDLIVHDGQSMSSVLTKRQRRRLLGDLDKNNYGRSFVVVNVRKEEIWYCYPASGSSWANKALVYNYETQAIGERDLPDLAYAAAGEINVDASGAWDALTGSWDALATPWNNATSNPATRSLLFCAPVTGKFYQADSTNQFNGSPITSYVERSGLAMVGKDRLGKPKVDLERRKIIRRVWPKLEGGPVTIKVLVQEELDGPVNYSPAMLFDPSTGQRFVDLPVPMGGLLMGIRVESAGDVSWRLSGYDIEFSLLGRFE